jgi:hypothetical protein
MRSARRAGVGAWKTSRRATDQRHREEGVAAEGEEVVVAADLGEAEDLGEDRRDLCVEVLE